MKQVLLEELFVQGLLSMLELLLLDHSARIAGVGIGSAAPCCLLKISSGADASSAGSANTHLAEGDGGIIFNGTMEPPKQD